MLDLVDSLLMILDLCFALICTTPSVNFIFITLFSIVVYQVELVQYNHSEPI